MNAEMAAAAQRWAAAMATSADRQLIQHLLARAAGLSPARLEVLAAAALLYAALFATEGIGLWRGRRWAEYLTAVATASFIPIELFEVTRGLTVVRLGALALNLAVVIYLIYRLRRTPRGEDD